MTHVLLTDTGGGVYALPAIRSTNSLLSVVIRTGANTGLLIDLTPAERRAVGWYELIEEGVDQTIFDQGAPSDALNGDVVDRTYPAKVIKSAADQKARRINEVNARALSVSYGGFLYPAGSPAGLGYATDEATVAFNALVGSSGGDLPAEIRDIDGTATATNPSEYRAFRDAMADHFRLTQANQYAHIDAINALSDPQEIVDYDITTGWPANPVL